MADGNAASVVQEIMTDPAPPGVVDSSAEEEEEPQNTPATGQPTITGTTQVGETLTTDTSAISNPDRLGNPAYTYQWLADGADISGATGLGYTLTDVDEGKTITVKASFTDDGGTKNP